jgi:hypothetical protein
MKDNNIFYSSTFCIIPFTVAINAVIAEKFRAMNAVITDKTEVSKYPISPF